MRDKKRRTGIKNSTSDVVFNVIIIIICVLLVIIFLYPLYFILVASFSSPAAVAKGQTLLLPKGITMIGYNEIFSNKAIWIGYRNTILYTFGGTFFSLLLTLPAAYALSRNDFAPRSAFMLLFTFTIFFNGGLIPTYLTVKGLHLDNTIWVLMVPFCVNVFNLIISRTFFQSSVPKELLEASQLDGCSDFRFFIQIALPISKALVSVIGLYYMVGYWNEYFRALIYIRNENLRPLQLIIREILIQNQSFGSNQTFSSADATLAQKQELLKYGVIVVSSLPMIIIFPFVQKYFEKGVMIGSIKG